MPNSYGTTVKQVLDGLVGTVIPSGFASDALANYFTSKYAKYEDVVNRIMAGDVNSFTDDEYFTSDNYVFKPKDLARLVSDTNPNTPADSNDVISAFIKTSDGRLTAVEVSVDDVCEEIGMVTSNVQIIIAGLNAVLTGDSPTVADRLSAFQSHIAANVGNLTQRQSAMAQYVLSIISDTQSNKLALVKGLIAGMNATSSSDTIILPSQIGECTGIEPRTAFMGTFKSTADAILTTTVDTLKTVGKAIASVANSMLGGMLPALRNNVARAVRVLDNPLDIQNVNEGCPNPVFNQGFGKVTLSYADQSDTTVRNAIVKIAKWLNEDHKDEFVKIPVLGATIYLYGLSLTSFDLYVQRHLYAFNDVRGMYLQLVGQGNTLEDFGKAVSMANCSPFTIQGTDNEKQLFASLLYTGYIAVAGFLLLDNQDPTQYTNEDIQPYFNAVNYSDRDPVTYNSWTTDVTNEDWANEITWPFGEVSAGAISSTNQPMLYLIIHALDTFITKVVNSDEADSFYPYSGVLSLDQGAYEICTDKMNAATFGTITGVAVVTALAIAAAVVGAKLKKAIRQKAWAKKVQFDNDVYKRPEFTRTEVVDPDTGEVTDFVYNGVTYANTAAGIKAMEDSYKATLNAFNKRMWKLNKQASRLARLSGSNFISAPFSTGAGAITTIKDAYSTLGAYVRTPADAQLSDQITAASASTQTSLDDVITLIRG